MTEAMMIHEVILTIIQNSISNIIIKSDSELASQAIKRDVIIESNSQLVIRTITGNIKILTQIYNLVKDIKVIAKVVKKLNFICFNRSINMFTDRIA